VRPVHSREADYTGDAVHPACVSWPAHGDLGGAAMFIAGDNGIPGGGFEMNANCYLALKAWRERGEKAALYTPDPGFALLAAEEADAVFIGPLHPEPFRDAMRVAGARVLTPRFGGPAAMDLAGEVADEALQVWGMDGIESGAVTRGVLEKVKSAGLPVVDYAQSEGIEDGAAVLRRGGFPILAEIIGERGVHGQHLVYSYDDGEELLGEYPDVEILWRPLHEDAQEVQVEAVGSKGGRHVILLWEQVDAAGISSCDGLAVYPPSFLTSQQSLRALELAARVIEVLEWTGNLSMSMRLSNGDIGLWSASPGPSHNLSFLQRASSMPLISLGISASSGESIVPPRPQEHLYAVRAPLIPFAVIAGSDILPSPQRRSTGAVMGIASDPGVALSKALWSQGLRPQAGGKAFLSVANREKRRALLLARELMQAGYVLLATRGTAHALAAAGMEVETVNKLREGRPNILDLIRNGQVGMVVNIPRGKHPHSDGFYIRAASAHHGIPCITDMEVALALARGLRQAGPSAWELRPLQEYGRSRHEVREG
jgi:carbamoyl-phosphate synthase large subunit